MDNSCQQYNLNQLFAPYDPQRPAAYARIRGGKLAPCIDGNVFFYQLEGGVYIKAYITGIPDSNKNGQLTRFHGFHIHENGDCQVGQKIILSQIQAAILIHQKRNIHFMQGICLQY